MSDLERWDDSVPALGDGDTDLGSGGQDGPIGIPSVGGTSSGGGSQSGGANSGGSQSGGTSSGGASSGGGQSGGTSSGGASGGGGQSGGTSSGGASSGGASSGGASSGGAPTALIVTTASDEDDAGATVGSPGQTGLSLREAMTIANNEPGHQSITFEQAFTINLSLGVLPDINETMDILGGVTIDGSFAGGTEPCLKVLGSDVVLNLLTITNCPAEPILVAQGSRNEVSDCIFLDNEQSLAVAGDDTLVQGNFINGGNGAGIYIAGNNPLIISNYVQDIPGHGIYLTTSTTAALVLGNVVVRAPNGIAMEAPSSATVWHNTFFDSTWSAVDLGSATGVDMRNNIIVGPAQYGIEASDSQFTNLDHNLFYDTPWGTCSSCSGGSSAVYGDPQFVNPGAGDFSLQSWSPAVDAGFDLGEDRNQGGAGLFNGSAPDIGAFER